jgi:putative protease
MSQELKEIGKITHFFDKIMVAAIELSEEVKVGDTIVIKGETTNFEQKLDSMQVDKQDIQQAKPGDDIGIKVKNKVRVNDKVYKKLN